MPRAGHFPSNNCHLDRFVGSIQTDLMAVEQGGINSAFIPIQHCDTLILSPYQIARIKITMHDAPWLPFDPRPCLTAERHDVQRHTAQVHIATEITMYEVTGGG
jgi:hypothetical protein